MSENHHSGTAPNWLAFSLSHPHMKLNQNYTSSSSSSSPSSSMPFLSPLQPAICFDGGGESNNSGFLSPPPLTVMPLKSDGSLCIIEALSRSSQQPSHERKLEKFMGGETCTMGLSLDSLYYDQNAAQEAVNNKQQNQYASFFSALACQGYYQAPLGGFGELQQGLSLSMSPGSQSSCVTASQANISPPTTPFETKKREFAKVCPSNKQTVHRKSIDTFGQRTSQFRGVTKWTGRYEAHLWDNSCKKEGQTRKGRQVYLGGYDMEEKAARAYDLAALKYWGLSTHTNFPIENYKEEIEEMKNMTRQEYVAHLRRKSSGFSRGASMYRGVTRHHQHGRWQARIGRVAGNKDLYLGTFSTQEEAAEAYDVAAIKFRGTNAVTNFDISRYHVEKIMASNALLAGEQAKRNKVELTEVVEQINHSTENSPQWKMVSQQAISPHTEFLDPKLATITSPRDPLFSLGFQDDLVGPTEDQESSKLGPAHFSNSSSLVTSLNSSREGTPERSLLQLGSRFVGGPTSAWINTPVPVAQLPVFAAWGDI